MPELSLGFGLLDGFSPYHVERWLLVLNSSLVPSLRSRVWCVCRALISPAVSLIFQVRQLLHKAYGRLKKWITFFHLFIWTLILFSFETVTTYPCLPWNLPCKPSWLQITADQAGLASQTLGFKVCATIPHPAINILKKIQKSKIPISEHLPEDQVVGSGLQASEGSSALCMGH